MLAYRLAEAKTWSGNEAQSKSEALSKKRKMFKHSKNTWSILRNKLEQNLNQKYNKLEIMLQQKQNFTFSTQLVYFINLFKFIVYFYN